MADTPKGSSAEEVVEESINAYRVQKMGDGSVRIKSGGHVVQGPTYFDALKSYAESEREDIEDAPDHLKEDKLESIADGYVPLKSMDSSGFTPMEILTQVTGQREESIRYDLDDSDDDESGGSWRTMAKAADALDLHATIQAENVSIHMDGDRDAEMIVERHDSGGEVFDGPIYTVHLSGTQGGAHTEASFIIPVEDANQIFDE